MEFRVGSVRKAPFKGALILLDPYLGLSYSRDLIIERV